MADFDIQSLCGWLGADETQKGLAASMPTFSQAAPHLMMAPTPTDPVLLYKAWKSALGDYPKYVPQQCGDCVSHGNGHGNDLLQCIQIGLGDPLGYQETDTEFIYGASREIAGILGRQDGSYGAAAVKAMSQWGMLSRSSLGSDGAYSGQRAKQWGLSGVPDDLKTKAAAFKLGASAQVTTWDELVAALQNGYPVPECSYWLPDGKRDANGFGGQSGSGGHCQLICAVRFDIPGAFIFNSWGESYYSGPTGLDAPGAGQWVARSTVEKILDAGDTWAISKTAGFVKRDVPSSWSYSDLA